MDDRVERKAGGVAPSRYVPKREFYGFGGLSCKNLEATQATSPGTTNRLNL
jgi:hypothetical protein